MNKNQDSEEIFSIYNLLSKIKNFLYFLKTKNNQFFLGVYIAIFFTISYNYLISPTHFARTTFVLDNDSSEGMGELSSIASLAGINPSSFIDASSLFQIDNIQDLYRSNAMLKKTLLSNGFYTINVPNLSGEIEFSVLGFETQVVSINNRRTINITLNDS